VLKFGFNLYSLVHTCIVDHMHTQFRLTQNSNCAVHPERKYCVGSGMSVLEIHIGQIHVAEKKVHDLATVAT
jgi:hypothetical protein